MTCHLPDSEKKEHDEIITSVESILTKQGHLVRTNPSTFKKNSVRRGTELFYPDLYVYEKKSSNDKDVVTRLYEVETEQTVNDEEANDQWKNFAEGTSDFYLVIPKVSVDKAKSLVKKYGIIVKDYYKY